MVRFFGTKRKASEDGRTPAKPAKSEPATATTTVTDKKPATRRRAPSRARPPRRDWAAEAAATPVEAPLPRPASLAKTPTDDETTAPAAPKRRRGTRGGRGRKKPAAAAPVTAAPAEKPAPPRPAPKPPAARPATIEEAVAQQAAALDRFAHDVTASMASLQASIGELQAGMAARPPAVVTSRPRVGVFVDVPNVIYAAERRGVTIDFGKVLEYFTRNRELVRASAYAPISDDPAAKLESQRFVYHFLGHPYRIITKPLKRFADGSMKANFDIELAIDILTMSDRLDIVVLMSGDGDFRRLVELIASRGVRVEVVAFGETASAELKAVADQYIDIAAHLDEFKATK